MKPFSIAAIVLMTALPQASFALAGTVGGGGGAQIEAAFRLRAQTVIAQIADSSEANALCSADTMREAMKSKIRIVDQLIDPVTGQPPTETNLDAYTIPGDMQLLKSSWTKFFEANETKTGRSVDVLLIHEIYRATKTCNDEKFAISEKIFSLLEQPGSSSITLKLRFKNPHGENTFFEFTDKKGVPYDPKEFSPAELNSVVTVCDQNMWSKEAVGKHVTCLSIAIEDQFEEWGGGPKVASMRLLQGKVKKVNGDTIQFFASGDLPDLIAIPAIDQTSYTYFKGLMKGVNQNRPVFFVYDLDSGQWTYGFKLSHLTPIE